MKKSLLICLVLFSVVKLQSQTKVLFLGNSFSYLYDVPALFSGLANSAGISVTIDKNLQSGMAVADEQITGHINDATSQAKISSRKWDYIVVQDNMGDYINSVGSLPASCGNANVTLYNQIKANNPCTRIIYTAEWGPLNGVTSGDNTNACINRVHGNMCFLNDNVGNEIVSPIGKAWITSFSSLPGVNLYYSDNTHPSLEGSYLAAATIFTTIFKKDPSGLTYTGGVNSSTAATMRSIAYSTVIDPTNMLSTNLDTYTPVITANGNLLTSSGTYPTYQWFLNGNPVGTNSKTYTALASGTYTVRATGNSTCTYYSFEKNIVVTGIGNYSSESNFILTPVSKNIFELSSSFSGTVSVYDMQGKLVNTHEKNTDQLIIDLTNSGSGMYFVSLINNSTNLSRKIVIE